MADNKKSFLLYADLIHTVKKLPDENAGILFKLILEYVNDLNPDIDSFDILTQVTFEPIRQQLKRDLKEWEIVKVSKSNNGRIGNLKRWNKDLFDLVISESMTLDEAESIAKNRKTSQGDIGESQRVANIAVNVNDNVTVNVNDNKYELIFDEFRKLYQGTKRGNETEFVNLKKKHKDWKEVLPNLKTALLNQIKSKEKKKSEGKFIPEWKNLQTWINQRCWEEVVDIEPILQQPPIRKLYQRIEP